jgi:DNA polymerase III sliding clamp (beta) subunit (PCNA family)
MVTAWRCAPCQLVQSLPNHSVIVPRKGVIELMRMLDGGENPLRVQIGSNNIRAHVGDFIFTRSSLTVVSRITPRIAEKSG